jgi:hypothetical protein
MKSQASNAQQHYRPDPQALPHQICTKSESEPLLHADPHLGSDEIPVQGRAIVAIETSAKQAKVGKLGEPISRAMV